MYFHFFALVRGAEGALVCIQNRGLKDESIDSLITITTSDLISKFYNNHQAKAYICDGI